VQKVCLSGFLLTRAHTRGATKVTVTNGGLAKTPRPAPSLQVATTDRHTSTKPNEEHGKAYELSFFFTGSSI